ncbi:type II toxin-antitoxin system ParD family antitoxin [Paraburkholderia tropica]|uniref:type II toxin-antitoxin system ParD family antitoxin n=1 Tax=Paraburkholderia tropica TaxID=92647 RepID=UPI001616A06B|nr:type II toxin-antitoxin system ParD family antitoxin [Paraburkholderia tropica]MBB2983369.1 putative addiction module CopG family antidote [Paraburkholderia tropica]
MPSKHTVTVSLTEHLHGFLRAEMASGRYRTASEVIRAGLRLLEAQALLQFPQGDGQAGRSHAQDTAPPGRRLRAKQEAR